MQTYRVPSFSVMVVSRDGVHTVSTESSPSLLHRNLYRFAIYHHKIHPCSIRVKTLKVNMYFTQKIHSYSLDICLTTTN